MIHMGETMEILKISDFFRGELDRKFDLADRPPPTIIFDPVQSALPYDSFRLFSKMCDRQAVRAGGAIARSALRLDDFGGMVDFMAVVERGKPSEGEPAAWRFAFSGWETDFAQMEPLAKRSVSEALSPPVAKMMTEVWTHAATGTGARVLTAHSSPREMLQADWTVLSIPLLNRDGPVPHVDGFLLYARAMNKLTPGLDLIPDPVMIVDTGQTVRMVNEAARTLFGEENLRNGIAVSLADYTKSDLELTNRSAGHSLKARRLRKTCRCLLNGSVVPMQATIAPLYHNGLDYMVVVMHPD